MRFPSTPFRVFPAGDAGAVCLPFRVADETQVCSRVKLMMDLARDGVQSQKLAAFLAPVRARADQLIRAFTDDARADPSMQNVIRAQAFRDRILAMEILRAVQWLPYVRDPENEEWMQCADYTIANGGDCKDSSVLYTAACLSCGISAEPYWITQTGQSLNHVTARVFLDQGPFWADGSIRGAMLGESPYEAEERLQSGVTGLKASGRPVGARSQHGRLFPWWGWRGLWSGWPAWWWCRYYPYLCGPYPTTLVA